MVGKIRNRKNLPASSKTHGETARIDSRNIYGGCSCLCTISRFGTTRDPWYKARSDAHATTPRNAVAYAPKKLRAEKQKGKIKRDLEVAPVPETAIIVTILEQAWRSTEEREYVRGFTSKCKVVGKSHRWRKFEI